MRGCDVDFLPQFVDESIEITHIRDTLEFLLMPFSFGDVLIIACIFVVSVGEFHYWEDPKVWSRFRIL